jgi:chloramphenicol 3-O-phosphotransferase
MRPDLDVDVLQVGVTLCEEERADRHHRDDRQADDEEQRQTGKTQPVHRPELLEEEQLETAAAVSAAPSWVIKLVRLHCYSLNMW